MTPHNNASAQPKTTTTPPPLTTTTIAQTITDNNNTCLSSVSRIKKTLRQELKIPLNEQELLYESEILAESMFIAESDFRNEDEVGLTFVRLQPRVQICPYETYPPDCAFTMSRERLASAEVALQYCMQHRTPCWNPGFAYGLSMRAVEKGGLRFEHWQNRDGDNGYGALVRIESNIRTAVALYYDGEWSRDFHWNVPREFRVGPLIG
eukprot:TRINITY_DN18483_c3_g1_i5.p1 TRINITY_DN18483_c3_g1~~TRINITY_DN18483_c3_g1_i5.p1  ORF type:complete len:208 (+),score=25.42 TRINITY_DN18483_c3_g1_i5:32-655(+)